ncbi:MAG: nucleotidyltransferase domain-containing protein [Fimbriimonadales bacterium]|nr:nucleotidyltransferase domain-containing protein [Fimbriimonadales bacterium]
MRTDIWQRLGVSPESIAALCQRWRIVKLELFGSALRDDFRPDSDIDLLATYEPGVYRSAFRLHQAEQEFERLLRRPVELVSRRAIERSPNPFRRRGILENTEILYAV